MAMEVVQEDVAEGNMQCTNHPYKNSTPGGICAFCLQEKLGKLVSSSFSVAFFPSSSSSSSPSFRSEFGNGSAAAGGAATINSQSKGSGYNAGYTRKPRLPFVLTNKKKKKKNEIVFNRSKSTATPRRGIHFLEGNYREETRVHRRRFWSFLYMSSTKGNKKGDSNSKDMTLTSARVEPPPSLRKREDHQFVVVEENDESPDEPGYDRKVSRSRSVGCGSRSFSGDLFERISNGFGDCTLRRVESQREGKSKVQRNGNNVQESCIKERVKCGGIFSGFMITSSSSSSSSSSYMVSEDKNVNNGKVITAANNDSNNICHGRSKSWGWASLASPMRVLGKTYVKRDSAARSSKKSTPNLAAIPSLLAVSG